MNCTKRTKYKDTNKIIKWVNKQPQVIGATRLEGASPETKT